MNIVRHKIDPCPACGYNARVAGMSRRACSNDCMRTSAGTFLVIDTVHNAGHQAHLHVTCNICEFEWLAEVVDEDGVKQAW